MKKFSIFALMLLLVGQTIFGPLLTIQASAAGISQFTFAEKKSTVAGGELSAESEISLEYQWNLSEELEQDSKFSLPFPSGLTAVNATGTVQANGAVIAYSISNGMISASITKEAPTGTGSFKIAAKLATGATGFTFAGQTANVPVIAEEPVIGKVVEKADDTEKESIGSDSTEKSDDHLVKDQSLSNDKENESDSTINDETGQADSDNGESLEADSDSTLEKPGIEEDEEEPTDSKENEIESNPEEELSNEDDEAKEEVEGTPVEIKENILTGVELYYKNKNDGEKVESVDKDTVIGLKYTWALKDKHGYPAGSTYSFQLPPELKIFNTVNKEKMMFNNEVIGYFSVDMNGRATIEFTNMINEYSNVNGFVEVQTELRQDTIITDGEVVITPIAGGHTVTIPVNFNPGGPVIEKSGKPNRAYNGETITWTVDVNKSLESLKNANVLDPDQAGQEFVAGSLKVYNLNVKMNGHFSVGSEVNPSGVNFPLHLGDIKSAYRIVYETKITDAEATKFTNIATLEADGKEKVSATAETSIQRGKPLEKKASKYNKAEQSIEWEVRYNYNEKKISQSNAVLNDLFTNNHKLIQGSFVVKEITINPETGAESRSANFTNYGVTDTSTADKNGFTFSFNQDIEKAYKITYKTKAADRIYDNTEVKNEVASGTYHSGAIGQQVGPQILFKSHGTPDYKTKEIGWTIRANSDQHTMKDVMITDTFTNAGLTFKEDSLVITEGGSKVDKADYTVTKNGTNGFTVNFKKPIEKELVIMYKTGFDYETRTDKSKTYLENHANMKWKDTSGGDRELDAKASFTPDKYTQSNGFKNGSYNAVKKEITWEVGINYNLQTLDKAVVEDTFDGNQKLLKDTLKVYKMSLTGGSNGVEVGKAVEGKDYEITDIADNQFKVVFKQPISEPYKIVYNTSVEDVDLVAKTYKNTATLFNDGTKQTELNATVTTPYGGNYTNKTGKQNGMVIDWDIAVNFAESHVKNAEVFDEPDTNQVILQDTLKVYKAKVVGNEKVEQGALLNEGSDYTVSFTENPDTFTLKFTNPVNEPYVLKYQTRIIAKVGTEIKNKVSFTGDNVVEKEGSSNSVKVALTTGMGGGTGELGSLTVVKQDAKTGGLLPGAAFSLVDLTSGATLATAVTGEDGKVFFDRLLYGTYKLKEVKAPERYVGVADQEVTIDTPYEKDHADKKGNTITVKNKKIHQSFELTKVDAQDNSVVLEGVVFKLQKKNGNLYEDVEKYNTLTTNKDGIILVEDLEPGEYQLIEITTLDSHWLDQTPQTFKITKNQTEVTKRTMKNDRIGNITIQKVDAADDKKVLEGAEFVLFDTNGVQMGKTVTSNKDGLVVFTGIKYGTYTLKELTAPNGYVADPINKTVVINDKSKEAAPIVVTNEEINQAVKLIKVDSKDSSKTLEGAEFVLYDELGKVVTDADGNEIRRTTNAQGELTVNNLAPGNYYFLETKAPEHYLLEEDEEKRKTEIFTITKNQTVFTPISAKNQRGIGSLIIKKIDADTDELLDGVEFELRNSAGGIVAGTTSATENGMLEYKELPYDTYTLKETKPKKGYADHVKEYTFVVNDTEKNEIVLEKTIENKKLTHSVKLTKYNASKSLKLAGAVFQLRKMDSSLAIGYQVVENIDPEKLKTDSNGEIYLDNLEVGEYQFVETNAPSGYYLDKTPIPFEITAQQTETITVEMINKRIYYPPSPVDPVKPTNPPTDPGKPVEPEKPTDPPTDPEKPVDPEKPTDPPTDPEKPVEPEKPTDPPTDPEKPVNPEKPTNPPTDPEKPVDPGKPTDTDKLSLPGKPGQPGKPGTPGKPGQSGSSSYSGSSFNGEKLPQTGEAYPVGTIAGGIAFILLGGWLLLARRKREMN
ncbi:SpaA isopeptide-forming pilin-related protein [Sporosarcina aquimarina]|uniref:SpaA isopeptide-forming pilin-related protein n=1 Tax=Sporosarcina aquimarina TaxID=114975 RepID=A0ABU4FX47_9BACL|nr:SpaA isopeptide-forming pilin-related protein [Sporosarcina aquimarina]MDW0108707.1 SpaA isopeptide-forming pilin-related protein [Sporosarcina aquimarina]